MRVLHLNNPAQVATNLIEAQRSLGIESSLVVTSTKGWHSNFDHNLSDIDTNHVKGKLEVGKKLYNLIKECDILHYHGQAVSAGYRDLFMWSGIMDKPVVLHHHGSEVRNKEYPEFANNLVRYRYVSTPDLLEFVPDAEWLPNPVNLDNLEYSPPKLTGPLRILHAPTDREVKNTSVVIDSISKVESEGLDVELNIVENLSHSELMKCIAKNDLVIDWVNPKIGIYGVFSIESMALGRAVICTLDTSLYEDYDLPIINTSPSNLVNVIKEIYNNRKILLDKGKSGHDFAHKNHNSLEAAKKVIRTYEKILAKD